MAILALAASSTCAGSVLAPFSNTFPITINDAPPDGVAKASPYPSVIHVSGIAANTITKAEVILSDFSHTFPDDVDILLVAPDGTRSIVMSDAGGGVPASHLQLTFSATGAAAVPNDTVIIDTAPLRPANYRAGDASGITDIFPSPGPGSLVMDPADFDVFNGINPNGDWSLYVVDDSNGDSGAILGGWTLVLTVPTVYTVTKTLNVLDGTCDSDCSLRDALAAAGDGDLIRFASPLFDHSQTIMLGGPELAISKSVTIEGPGADLLSISGNYVSRVFNIGGGHAVTLKGLTIRDGYDSALGGGILNGSQLTLGNVAFTGNKAGGSGLGGAIYQTGNGNFTGCTFSDNLGNLAGAIFFANPAQVLRLVNSTISGNRSGAGAIGVSSANGTDLRLDVIDSTIADNASNSFTGGIGVQTQTVAGSTATVTLRNSIIANNGAANFYTHASTGPTSIDSLGFNLTNDAVSSYLTDPTDIVGVDPRLGPLNNNGGHLETRALLGGSPALDAGHGSGYPKDVRGVSRSFDSLGAIDVPGDYSDIGATEMHAIFVSTTADGDAGSLRLAMGLANVDGAGQDDILFDPNVFGATPQTINLAGALPDIQTSLSVHGPGAKLLTVRRDTGGDYRIFDAEEGYEVALSGLTISNGHTSDSGAGVRSLSRLSLAGVAVSGNTDLGTCCGGGIELLYSDGTIKNSTFDGNVTGGSGGGIYLEGQDNALRVSNTTLSGNQGQYGGGIGIASELPGFTMLELRNSTVANNIAPNSGGIDVFAAGSASATARLRNSIVANNSAPNLGAEMADLGSASIISLGYNLTDDYGPYFDPDSDKINTDPLLAPLADNGGPTKTRALLAGSPAIDAGHSSGALSDQRGRERPIDFFAVANASGGDTSDIGAFEYQDVIFSDSFGD